MITRHSLAPLFAMLITAVCCAVCALPVLAHAAIVPDNPSGSTAATVSSGDFMALNKGAITENNGTVETNEGTITTNNATVKVNNGTIVNNYSMVPTNNGTIVNNFSVNVGTTANGPSAKIVNNYMGGYESGRLWGNNNFYRISSFAYPGLDWSLNPESFTTSQYLYIGDSGNPEGLRGAIFKAKDGYEISLKGTAGNGFTLTDHQDGTYSITVTDRALMDVNLGSAIEVKAKVMLDVKAAPSEGGAVYMNGAPFQPGYYDPRGQYAFSAVANEGYRFIGWESGDYEPDARVELDGDRATVSIWRAERAFTIGLTAKFEKIDSGNGPGDGNSGGSADPVNSDGSNSDKGAVSKSKGGLAQAGDSAWAFALAAAAVAVVASRAICVARRNLKSAGSETLF